LSIVQQFHTLKPVGVVLLTMMLSAIATEVAGQSSSLAAFETKTLNPGVVSEETPASAGVSFERVSIPSGSRQLDAFIVRAEQTCQPSAAVLIYHGRGETIADWVKVQRFLHDRCISSVAFDYSGHGHSSPNGTIDHLNEDAVAAASYFLERFSKSQRRCLLSHSLGGGPLLYAIAEGDMKPDCVVLGSPWSSFRAMAVLGGMPKAAEASMPDVWNNVSAARKLPSPLLWVHSENDRVIPLAFGRETFEAAPQPKSELVLPDFDHNAIYRQIPSEIWDPIARFMLGEKG
jgi:alpha-beta hydrolase superfamily lysophospholipase